MRKFRCRAQIKQAVWPTNTQSTEQLSRKRQATGTSVKYLQLPSFLQRQEESKSKMIKIFNRKHLIAEKDSKITDLEEANKARY